MDFFSLQFVIFLLAVVVLYYLLAFINKKAKKNIIPQWSILLIGSLLFYGLMNYVYLIYLVISSLISYGFALGCKNKEKNNPLFLIIPLILNIGILLVLKYYNFFISSVNSIFKLSWITMNFIVPLGISFYTFSLVSYNVDCYKGTCDSEKNPIKFILFVSYFPKLIQGPISSYDKLKEDGLFDNHSFIETNYCNSFYRIGLGLLKKIIIADIIGLYVNSAYANLNDLYGFNLILVSLLYSIQLYCDFSGFMDMMFGISGLFGIKLEENFNLPYLSSSISEFWRRWHITLGAWLKKYIYIPLGGNRVPKWRWAINILIVWLISGLWHGANLTFIIWGLYHGLLIIAFGLIGMLVKNKNSWERIGLFKKIVGIVITFILVNFGWIFFRSSNINEAFTFISHMFNFVANNSINMFTFEAVKNAWPYLIVAFSFIAALILLVVAIKYKNVLLNKIKNPEIISFIAKYGLAIVFIAISIFVFITSKSIGGGESSFIYFDF